MQERTYTGYNWTLPLTAAWRTDPDMVEFAHKHGGRIELNAGAVEDVMGDAAEEAAWVSATRLRLLVPPQHLVARGCLKQFS